MDRDPPPAGAIDQYLADLQLSLRLRPLLRRAATGPTWQLTGTVATAGAVRLLLADGRERRAARTGSRFAGHDDGAPPVAVLLAVAGRDCRVDLPTLPEVGLA